MFEDYTFHCSSLKNLMVSPRLKSETLSETTRGYLRDVYIEKVFGRRRADLIANKYVRKGVACETDSISLLEEVSGETYFKNQVTYTNDFITGTPDLVTDDEIIDIKTSWDIWTFAKTDEKQAYSDYYYQLLGYMALTDKKKARLAYVLVNTEEGMISDELYRLQFYIGEDEAMEYRKNFVYDDIDKKLRVKTFDFEFSEDDYASVVAKVEESRKFLEKLSL